MKKTSLIFNLLSVILCGMTTQVTADYCNPINCNDCCEWSVLDGKMTLGVDWLYWKVQQDGILPGSINIVETDPLTLTPVTRTRRVHSNSKWDNGFRVNLGYELPCDCWDMNICYTYMPSRSKVANFTSIAPNETFSPNFTSFASSWRITFNNVDLDIGRTVSFGECLKMRPHVGFRAAWFDQKYRSTGIITAIEAPNSISGTSTKETFQGYGVEAGICSDYSLGYGLSLVGHFGGSILYSKFHVRTNDFIATTDAAGIFTPISAIIGSDTFYTATPSVDYFVGLQFADAFCDMIFKARLGWEQHLFFDTNRFLSSGNLSGQGLTLGVDVGF